MNDKTCLATLPEKPIAFFSQAKEDANSCGPFIKLEVLGEIASLHVLFYLRKSTSSCTLKVLSGNIT